MFPQLAPSSAADRIRIRLRPSVQGGTRMSIDLDHARSFVMGLDLPAPRFGAAAAPSAPINFDAMYQQALAQAQAGQKAAEPATH